MKVTFWREMERSEKTEGSSLAENRVNRREGNGTMVIEL